MQRVILVRRDDSFDAAQDIALGFTALGRRSIQEDLDAGVVDDRLALAVELGRHIGQGIGVIDSVEAGPAIDRIGTLATDEGVVLVIAGQLVGKVRADHVLDVLVGIALGEALGALAGRQVDLDPLARARVLDRVAAQPTVDHVGAGAGDDPVVAVTGIDLGARGVREQDVDRLAADRIGHGHAGRVGHFLDPEVRRHRHRERAGLAIRGQAQHHGQEEFILEAAAVDRGSRGRQLVGQLDVEAEERLVDRQGDGLVGGRIDLGRHLGDVALVGRDQPALVGQRAVDDGVARRQRRNQKFFESQPLGRHHGFDMEDAHGRTDRSVVQSVGIDRVIARGAADRFLGRLPGEGGILGRVRTTGVALDHRLAGFRSADRAFRVVQRVGQLGDKLADTGRPKRIIGRRLCSARRDHARRRGAAGRGVADLFGELAGAFRGLDLGIGLGGLIGLLLTGIAGLHARSVLRIRCLDLGVGAAEVQLQRGILGADLANHAHGLVGGEFLVVEDDDRLAPRERGQGHARDDDLGAVVEDQHHVDVDDLNLERRILDADLGLFVGVELDDLRGPIILGLLIDRRLVRGILCRLHILTVQTLVSKARLAARQFYHATWLPQPC